MVRDIVFWLEVTAQILPLPLFVIIGGIVEEIMVLIPSVLAPTLAGRIIGS